MTKSCSPFGGIPRNWKLDVSFPTLVQSLSSPFGGIPRNWKLDGGVVSVPSKTKGCSPFGGIPRNWKLRKTVTVEAPANAIANGRVENAVIDIEDSDDDDDYGEEEEFAAI